ncbi:MAG: GNAT family N-acetyltransferase, partial [Desulfobacula sp.]|nr:GNAT family N-acetyltransferase [Desulfobacula sp.]
MDVLRMNITVAEVLKSYKGLFHNESMMFFRDVMAGYDGHRGWINYLAVRPQHQRTGVARQMMDEAETSLRALDCPKINLQVRSTNAGVIEFYKT